MSERARQPPPRPRGDPAHEAVRPSCHPGRARAGRCPRARLHQRAHDARVRGNDLHGEMLAPGRAPRNSARRFASRYSVMVWLAARRAGSELGFQLAPGARRRAPRVRASCAPRRRAAARPRWSAPRPACGQATACRPCSRLRLSLETAGWLMYRRRPAQLMLPRSTAAQNARRSPISGNG